MNKLTMPAESPAREAMALCESVGREELIASNCRRLARALVRQGNQADALPYARRAVEIFTQLSHPDLQIARAMLGECELGPSDADQELEPQS